MIQVGKPKVLDTLPEGKGVIQASAGTGKTHVLERLVVDLILKGVKLEKILVVTFTEKATLELRARIRKLLEKLSTQTKDSRKPGEPAWAIDEKGQQALAEALRSFERATISTIHGFCRRILMQSAFEGGALLKQELVDGRALLGRAWRDLVRGTAPGTPMGNLLKDVLAGGMSFEEIEDLLWGAHCERGTLLPAPAADSTRLLAECPCGWEARWPDLEEAISGLEITDKHKDEFRSLHRRFFRLMGRNPSAYLLKRGCSFHFLVEKKVLTKGGVGHPLWEWMARFDQGTGTPESMIVHFFRPEVGKRIRAIKDDEGLFDHDDSILQVLASLEGSRRMELLARIREDYQVALIDEFQDTDQAQWQVFQHLFGESGSTLYVIGDPKQAIYGFRGGDLPTYRLAAEDLLQGATPEKLEENHRSAKAVLDAYNLIFTGGSRNKKGVPVTAFFSDPNLYPAGSAVKCGNLGLVAEPIHQKGETAPVRVLRLETLTGGQSLWNNVARVVAKEIGKLVTEIGIRFGDPGAEEPEKQLRDLQYGDVQVLVEKKKQGRQMADALRAEGIPYAFFKQEGLLDCDEALDLKDCLAAVLEPRDRTCLARALVTPFFGYAWKDLEALNGLAEDHPAILRILEWQGMARQRQFPRLFEAMLHQSGLVQRLRILTESERSLTNHLHLVELLTRYARENAANLEDLVRLMKRWQAGTELPPGENPNMQRLEGERNAVQILTMHQSKGLEAPIVALFGFTKPNYRATVKRFHRGNERCAYLGSHPPEPIAVAIKQEREEEAERLLYVALTRARARLILPCFVANNASGGPRHPEGTYKILNRRLRSIIETEGRADLFRVVDVNAGDLERAAQRQSVDLRGWVFQAPPAPEAKDYQGLRDKAQPPFTASYTSLRHLDKSTQARDDDQEMLLDGEQEAPPENLGQEGLPGSAKTGLCLHKLLEVVDLKSAEGRSFEDWWREFKGTKSALAALGRFGLLTSYSLDRSGRKVEHATLAGRMVYEALRAPLGGAPISQSDHVLRELGFLSRFLDTEDLLAGAMDAVFEREGKVHLVDWKSDTLGAYDAMSMGVAVGTGYRVQVKIYLRVLLDYFGIESEADYTRRFGGVHYVFLRGLPGQGVWSQWPTWAEVVAWKNDLARLHGMVGHV